MADHCDEVVKQINYGDTHDLKGLLSSSERDYLVRNNGDQVKIESLMGKKVGLYFSGSWYSPCLKFTRDLVEVYNELSSKGDFEIVFVSTDDDDFFFNWSFSKMPWLAIPYSDSEVRQRLDEGFMALRIPYLVIIDEKGKVLTDGGVEIILEYGVDCYPFTPERVKEVKEQEEKAARREQSLQSLLVSHSRDFVISADGKKVPVSELEGKIVGLYFTFLSFGKCVDFTPELVEVRNKLKGKGKNFEVVMIPLIDDEAAFKKGFESIPWLSLPCKDKLCQKLFRYFEISKLPTVVIIGPDGKTIHCNVSDAIEEHGVLAYPFTPEKFIELEKIGKAKRKARTLESILVSGDRDFVVGKDGLKIPVSDLVGKNILLYFSAHWCPQCRAFLPMLKEAYHKIKAKDDKFEVIFISSDWHQPAFDKSFSNMPWLALPFGDKRKASVVRVFKVCGIPTLVAFGPTGRTVATEAQDLIVRHGAEAYPFTEERLKEIEAEHEEMAKGWPEKVKHECHEDHELVLTRRLNRLIYTCDRCKEMGNVWSYNCEYVISTFTRNAL